MLIQCRENSFDKILSVMGKYEPHIAKDPGTGYINVFDKDWIFVSLSEKRYPEQTKKIFDELLQSDEAFIIADQINCRLIQQKISEHEQYLFCRKSFEGYRITNAWTTYISF